MAVENGQSVSTKWLLTVVVGVLFSVLGYWASSSAAEIKSLRAEVKLDIERVNSLYAPLLPRLTALEERIQAIKETNKAEFEQVNRKLDDIARLSPRRR